MVTRQILRPHSSLWNHSLRLEPGNLHLTSSPRRVLDAEVWEPLGGERGDLDKQTSDHCTEKFSIWIVGVAREGFLEEVVFKMKSEE